MMKKMFTNIGIFVLILTLIMSTSNATEIAPPYNRDEFLEAFQQKWDRTSVYYRRSERPTCMPELGEQSEQYQVFIEQYYPAGEFTAQTIRYRLLDSETRKPLPYVTLYIWSTDAADIDNTYFVMPIRSDKNGEVTFTLNRKSGMGYVVSGPNCWQTATPFLSLRITVDDVAYADTRNVSSIKENESSEINEILFKPVAPKGRFTDVPLSHWAYDSIQAMSDIGVMQGGGNSTFNPDSAITRAEFIAIVTRAMAKDQIDPSIKDTWYAANYKAAINAGLIQSSEMENVAQVMSANITRYEMARILVRADENINGNEKVTVDESAIKDYANIPSDFSYFVAQAYAKGLLSGYSGGMFSGEQNMTRAQAAVVMERLLNAKVETPEEPPAEPDDSGNSDISPLPPDRVPPENMPGLGEYTSEYQAFLDNCGEQIVTKTVHFRMIDMGTQTPLANVTMDVWRFDWNDSSNMMFVMTIQSGEDGNGSFALDMPQSLFDATMRGANGESLTNQYTIFGANSVWSNESMATRVDAVVNGHEYVAISGQLNHFYIRDSNPLMMELLFLQQKH